MRDPAHRVVNSNRDSDGKPGAREYLVCYLLFAGLILLSFLVFTVWKTAALVVIGALVDNRQAIPAIFGACIIAIGLSLFGLVMAAEPYLRAGVAKHQLRRRFDRLAIPLGMCIVLGVVVTELVTRLT